MISTIKRNYTPKGFENKYENDLTELYTKINNYFVYNKFKVDEKEKLFKTLSEYIYYKSDITKLND